MRNWSIVTVLLYALFLMAFSAPVMVLAGFEFDEAHDVLGEWWYWMWLGLLVLAQALLLFVPLNLARNRPTSRRHLLVPVLTSAFLFAQLFFGMLMCSGILIFGEDALEVLDVVSEWVVPDASQPSLRSQIFVRSGAAGLPDIEVWATLGAILLCFWLIWGFVFLRSLRGADEKTVMNRLVRWLLRGSILELLIAVPSHILSRHREDCCAPMFTFWGMATGFSVMILAFGPGIFFLFVERMQKLRPRADNPQPQET